MTSADWHRRSAYASLNANATDPSARTHFRKRIEERDSGRRLCIVEAGDLLHSCSRGVQSLYDHAHLDGGVCCHKVISHCPNEAKGGNVLLEGSVAGENCRECKETTKHPSDGLIVLGFGALRVIIQAAFYADLVGDA